MFPQVKYYLHNAFYWPSYKMPREILGEHICTVNVRLFASDVQEFSRNLYKNPGFAGFSRKRTNPGRGA